MTTITAAACRARPTPHLHRGNVACFMAYCINYVRSVALRSGFLPRNNNLNTACHSARAPSFRTKSIYHWTWRGAQQACCANTSAGAATPSWFWRAFHSWHVAYNLSSTLASRQLLSMPSSRASYQTLYLTYSGCGRDSPYTSYTRAAARRAVRAGPDRLRTPRAGARFGTKHRCWRRSGSNAAPRNHTPAHRAHWRAPFTPYFCHHCPAYHRVTTAHTRAHNLPPHPLTGCLPRYLPPPPPPHFTSHLLSAFPSWFRRARWRFSCSMLRSCHFGHWFVRFRSCVFQDACRVPVGDTLDTRFVTTRAAYLRQLRSAWLCAGNSDKTLISTSWTGNTTTLRLLAFTLVNMPGGCRWPSTPVVAPGRAHFARSGCASFLV